MTALRKEDVWRSHLVHERLKLHLDVRPFFYQGINVLLASKELWHLKELTFSPSPWLFVTNIFIASFGVAPLLILVTYALSFAIFSTMKGATRVG